MRFHYPLRVGFYVAVLLGFTCGLGIQNGRAQDGASASQQEAKTADEAVGSVLEKEGESLFKGNCTSCHAIHERVVGPALRDVHERRPIAWIKRFVKNSQKVIASGDPYAVKLYNEYNQTQMTAFDFSDAELDAIIAYIKVASAAPPPQKATASAETTADGEAMTGSGVSETQLQWLWVAIVSVLVLLLLTLFAVLAVVKQWLLQKQTMNEADREFITRKPSLKKIASSRASIGIGIFIFVGVLVKLGIEGMYGIGIQQGYAPSQPIAFSHKLHAGEYQIDCNYCHTGVRLGKSAHLPSVNICMNCHGEIKKDSKEIQKLYAAIEKDQPIEWVRVHNLPDLAYFNHAQHVEVGDIACQTCHGAIETMEVVAQHATLTMGWCINCHRETQINAKDNAYYDQLVALHAEHEGVLTVSRAGGLECSKCHY